MTILRGLSNVAKVANNITKAKSAAAQSSKIFAEMHASSFGTSVLSNLEPFLFSAVPPDAVISNFIGTVISGDEIRITLLADPHSNPIAGSTKNPEYEDSSLKEFLRSKESEFLKNQNVRKPVHILADFDYATLNRSLDEEADPDEESRNQPSGAARIWCRNENARDWKDWVANCLFAEIAIGPEGGTHDIRKISDDSMSVSFFDYGNPNAAARVALFDLTKKAYTSKENFYITRNLKQGYANVYLSEAFLSGVFKKNPFVKSTSDVLNLGTELFRNTFTSFGNGLSTDLIEDLRENEETDYNAYDSDKKTINDSFKFQPNQFQVKRFQLHKPESEQGFIKSVVESSRAIGDFLKKENFSYRDVDTRAGSDKPTWVENADFNTYKSDVKQYHVLNNNGNYIDFDYSSHSNSYVGAYRIRKIFLNSYFIKNHPEKRVYLKSLKEEGGNKVISFDTIEKNQDDIERLMCRILKLDSNNSVTVSPYLTNDYVVKSNGKTNHFLTLKDSVALKKSVLLNLVDEKFSDNRKADTINSLTERLSKFTFDHDPGHLANFMHSLKLQFCPVTSESSIDNKNGLLLLDHRNIVSHLTHGRVGQFITDATLEKLSVVNSAPGTAASYDIKITSQQSFAPRAAADLLNGNYRGTLDVENISDPESNRLQAKVYNTFNNQGDHRISEGMSSLLNSTFTRSVDSSRRKEYIFWCILLQLSDYDVSGNSSRTPYFMQYDNENAENVLKLPRIADALYAEYKIKSENVNFTSSGNNNIRDFGLSLQANETFSTVDLETKSKINEILLEEMRESCMSLDSGGPLEGAFSDIISLQDTVNFFPGIIDQAYNRYRETLFDVADRMTNAVFQDGARTNQNQQRILAMNSFLRNKPENRPDSWSLVIGDFISNGTENNQARVMFNDSQDQINAFRGRSARESRINFRNGNPTFQRRNGEVVGISGAIAGGRKLDTGFAYASIQSGDGVSNNFKNSALKGLKSKVLRFDRSSNILISLAENICAILFYGFPSDDSGRMFDQQFKSSFHKNEKGLLKYLGLLGEDNHLHMTQEEIFTVVWEYCSIADRLINQMPSVNMEFEFRDSVYRENPMENDPDEVYRESAQTYSLNSASSSLGEFFRAQMRVQQNANNYLPPDVMSVTDRKSGPGTRLHAQNTFGADSPEEAQARKEGLVNDLFDLTSRAAVFFKLAETEMSKEPQFRLRFKRQRRENPNTFRMLSRGMKLGFLPHISIDSDFSRHAITFMKRTTNRRANTTRELAELAVERYVGLGEKDRKISSNKFAFKIISSDSTPDDHLVPYRSSERIKYFDYTDAESRSSRNEGSFDSLEIMPRSCFGFVYNLGVTQSNNTSFNNSHFDSNLRINFQEAPGSRGRNMLALNQFPEGAEKEKLKRDISISTESGFEELNDYYSRRLALTPPKIYAKLLRKVSHLNEAINRIKQNTESATLRSRINDHRRSVEEFNLHALTQPKTNKFKKVNLEITVCKTSYHFMKALKSVDRSGHGLDEDRPVTAVEPASLTPRGRQQPGEFINEMISAMATFFKGSDMETEAERNSEDPRPIDIGPFYGYQTREDLTVELNTLGEHASRNIMPPIIPLGQSGESPLISGLQLKGNFTWQFQLLCTVLSKYEDLMTASSSNSAGLTTHVAPDPTSVRPGVRARNVAEMLGAYTWNKGSSRGYSQDIEDWIQDWQVQNYQDDFSWSDYYAHYSTNPPTFLRSNRNHRPATDGAPLPYNQIQTPYNPAKAIFSAHNGASFAFAPSLNRVDYAVESIGDKILNHKPEFFSSNKTSSTLKSDEKIKVEIYLIGRTAGAAYTHYSTEKIPFDQVDHPAARPINELYDSAGFDSFRAIVLRPSTVAVLQYKFNNMPPKYLGPIAPGSSPSFEGYFANEHLPFLPLFDWGKYLRQAMTAGGANSTSDAYYGAPKVEISTEEFLGIDRVEMSNHLSEVAEDMFRTHRDRAISYLNQLKYSIDTYITRFDSSLSTAQKDWLRKIPGIIPYFYDWRIQYPSLELDISITTQVAQEEPDILADIHWGAIKKLAIDNPTTGFQYRFDESKVTSVYNLQKQYLDFLFSMERYANTCSKAFTVVMELMEKNIDIFSKTNGTLSNELEESYQPNPRTRGGNISIVGRASNGRIKREVREFIKNNGFLGVTPDTISSLDCIYRLYKEQYVYADASFRDSHKSKGLNLHKTPDGTRVALQTPFKISPYDIRPPHQKRLESNISDSPTKRWQSYERQFSDPDRGVSALDSNFTRVCFLGIESGELQRILSAPLDSYGDNLGLVKEDMVNFQVKLELFDFFRPWLKFEYQDKIIISRQKPYRVTSPNSAFPNLGQNHIISPVTREILSNDLNGVMQDTAFGTASPSDATGIDNPRFDFGHDKYNMLDLFLKVYASKVLGLDFFSFMIPRQERIPPIADYALDSGDPPGLQPEERNYQEYLNEYTKILFDLVEEAASDKSMSDVNHILKYFYERKLTAPGTVESAAGFTGVFHSDSVGRSTLVNGESGFGGLFDFGAIELSGESPKFFPYKFSTPITETSLAAAEILTSTNEYSSNVMKDFRNGFMFDRVIGIPYKLKNFKISKTVRQSVSGENVDLSSLDPQYTVQGPNGNLILTDDYFKILLDKLPYLDKNNNDGFVASNSLYPLTLRASICRKEDDE